MAERQFLREFQYDKTRPDFVVIEGESGLTKITASATKNTVRKTVWQNTPTPSIQVGDVFLSGSTEAVCTSISVSDEVVSVEGKDPIRIWRVDIQGDAGDDNENARQRFTKSHSRENTRAEIAVVESSFGTVGTMEISSEKKAVRKTVWQTTTTPPVGIGEIFTVDGVEVVCEKIAIADEIISINGGEVQRLWQIEMEGSPASTAIEESGSRYMQNVEISSSLGDQVSYEDIDGTMQTLSGGGRRRVRYTSWQADSTPLIVLGGSFTINGVTAVCTSISVTDEVVSLTNGSPVRLWRVDIEGLEGEGSTPSGLPVERSISAKINGSVEIALNGETIILQRSTTPITTMRITVHSESETPPVAVGAAFEGGIVTGVDTTKTVMESNGVRSGVVYRHEMEVSL